MQLTKQKVVVISGAGISAESGLATFRDAGGLWQKYSVQELATPEAFARNPELVHSFYNARRKQAALAQPNDAHIALAKLESRFQVVVITQNVDDLHERAGSSNVIHLHGKLSEARSSQDPDNVYDIGVSDIEPNDTADDGTPLRPNIVWFGEDVPAMIPAIKEVTTADIILVVGTSLQVYPAASLLEFASKEAKKLVVNLDSLDYLSDYQFIQGKAAIKVPELVSSWLHDTH